MMTRLVTNSGLFCLINFLPDLYLSNKHFTMHCALFQQKILYIGIYLPEEKFKIVVHIVEKVFAGIMMT